MGDFGAGHVFYRFLSDTVWNHINGSFCTSESIGCRCRILQEKKTDYENHLHRLLDYPPPNRHCHFYLKPWR